ncbi:endonuclease/exonuclease/phosphatase family protein [Actinoplanes philippinensis]|uniref:endonuclease/exonuclease/phosphatase family protein n=1 Tax=Actinoplanes philippinensis TaxID=35752 RepID=UPI0033F606E6
MRLLTFNTLFRGDVRARLRALGPRLERGGYDVVCLQEVMYRRNARLIRSLTPSLRHATYTGSVLLEGGLVVLSRWPIVASEFAGYPRTGPVRPEFLMRKGARIATIATGDGAIVVAGTHLSARLDERYTAVLRSEFDHLAERLATIDPATPLAVVGDLNVSRTSSLLTGFLARTGLRDVLAGDPRPTYRPAPDWPSPTALDHVLVRAVPQAEARLTFQEEVRLDDGRPAYLSDHYGVEAELTW